jgi:hypothetical protein
MKVIPLMTKIMKSFKDDILPLETYTEPSPRVLLKSIQNIEGIGLRLSKGMEDNYF